MSQITFALAKGRLGKKTMEILEKMNIRAVDMTDDSRKLVFYSEDKKYRFFLSKPSDVPTYVEHGVADIGIVGKDTILEENRDIYECLDLNIGKCRMCVCAYPEKRDLILNNESIRIATKYPNIALKHFRQKNKKVEIIKLNGSVELGPIIGLADAIVDIVESGKTLAENGLVVINDVVSDISARVIVNKASMKLKHQDIGKIIEEMERLIWKSIKIILKNFY